MVFRMFTGILSVTLLAWASDVHANVIINDNFDSYADQAAFQAVWVPSGTSGTLSDNVSLSAPISVRNAAGSTQRNDFTFSGSTATDIIATDANPLVWSYSFYDDPANIVPAGNTLGRVFGQLIGRNAAGTTNQVLAMGLHNANAVKASNNVTSILAETRAYYHYRVGFSPGPSWIVMDTLAQRSAGWQEMKAVIGSTQVEFYLNGISGGTWNYATSEGAVRWFQARIGSGLSTTAAANFDNYRLEVVPEPSAMLLSTLGLLGLVGYRRRR